MLDALMSAGFFEETDGSGRPLRPEPSTELPSHTTMDIDEDGDAVLARFTYVDEETCIGCRNCAYVARNVFFMVDESCSPALGKARVFSQGGDDPELIAEAIETCPVDCIHYVSREDLVILEMERIERENSLDFNSYGSFKLGFTGQTNAVPETKAKHYGSLSMGSRCNNCPSRGCKDCPMFGVGNNPTYTARMEARRLKKEASGAAQAKRQEDERSELIGAMYMDAEIEGEMEAEGAAEAEAEGAPEVDDMIGALFGAGYSFGEPGFDDDDDEKPVEEGNGQKESANGE